MMSSVSGRALTQSHETAADARREGGALVSDQHFRQASHGTADEARREGGLQGTDGEVCVSESAAGVLSDGGGWLEPKSATGRSDGLPAVPDPTGLELASRIARAARGGRLPPRRRARRELTEVEWSGSGPSARDPQSVGALFDRVIAEKGWRANLGVASLLGQWPRFVGVVNAQHTTPERFHDGELVVRAESTTWSTAIRLLAPQIVARLNEALGEATVTSIKVLGPTARSWKKGRRSVPGRGPRDTYG